MTEENNKSRCRWCNLANPLYVRYHDEEWGVPCHDDHALYELLILESFQAGLSWETVLNKRARFREVYDGFDLDKVCAYGEEKIARLLSDEGIIRNRLKIRASVKNSRIFRDIQEEYGSFEKYIWGWTDGKVIYENDPAVTTGPLSDAISQDLKKRGMTFVAPPSSTPICRPSASSMPTATTAGCMAGMAKQFEENNYAPLYP